MTGLAQAIASLNGLPGRKTLILYSEGFIRSPSMPDYDRVVELARRNQVSIYYVDPRGLGRETSPGEIDMVSGGAIYLATATGGTASISNDLAATLRDLLLQSSTYYLLGFEPSPGVPGERRLQVSVRRDRHQVLAPDRYLVSEAPPSREAGSPGTLSDAAQEAAGAIADSAGLPLRVAALFGELPTGETSTTIAIELPRATAGGRPRHLDMLIEARPAVAGVSVHDVATMSVPAGDGPVVAARQLGLHAGVWQSRIVVRDPLSGAVGSVLHTFEVPLAVGLRISSPILSDELVAGPAPRPRLRVDRRFGSGATLYCLFRVLGAAVDDEAGKQRVTVDAAVRSSGGVVRAEEHSKIEAAKGGQLLEILKIGLGGLPVDEYRLVLTVRDAVTGRTHTVEEPFSVVGAN